MAHYDVAIAGAGPGGSYAAKTAAELGLKTIFFERARKVGEKNASCCGLGQRWWRDFPEEMEAVTNLPSFREIHFCQFKITGTDDRLITTISSARTSRDEERIRYKGKNLAMTGASIYRCDLDPMLADLAVQAGAELRTSTCIVDVLKKNGRVRGLVTDTGKKIEADLVIGADGAHSTVAIRSGIRKRFEKKDITLIPQLDFSCDPQRMDDIYGDSELVWFGPYCGAYQVNFADGFHLGLGQWLDLWDTKPRDMIKRIMGIPAFQSMCRALDAQVREYQVHLLPWMPHPPKTFADGVLLVGDAGGFPCPLEGEGVWHALWTGKIAAQVAASALSASDVSEAALSRYKTLWGQSPIGREYEYGQEFVNLWRNSAFNPKFMEKMVLLLGELQWLNFPSPIFDWSDDHMKTFNDHLGHLLDLLPEFGDFARENLAPLKRGISRDNLDKIADLITGPVCAALPGFIPEALIRNFLKKKMAKALYGDNR